MFGKNLLQYTSDSGLIPEVHKELKEWRKTNDIFENMGLGSEQKVLKWRKKQWLINITKCLFSLEIREIYIKVALKFHLTSVSTQRPTKQLTIYAGDIEWKGTLIHCWWHFQAFRVCQHSLLLTPSSHFKGSNSAALPGSLPWLSHFSLLW